VNKLAKKIKEKQYGEEIQRKPKKRAVVNTAPNKKNIKRRKNISKFIKWTTLFFLIVGSIIFLFTTPIFNVSTIDVVGNKNVTTNEIISLSQIQIGENTFKNSKKDIIKNIKENAYIDKVIVKRYLPSKVEITVEERNVKFIVKLVEGYAYISSQGYILEISEEPKDVPMLEKIKTSAEEIIVGKRLNIEDLKRLQTVLKIVSVCEENEIYSFVTSIEIGNTNDYKIYMGGKQKVAYIGDASNLTTRILYVKKIMEEEEGKEGEIFVNGDLNDGFKSFFRQNI